jgi:hypothetical protein
LLGCLREVWKASEYRQDGERCLRVNAHNIAPYSCAFHSFPALNSDLPGKKFHFFNRDFRFGPLACASYSSPAFDTTNLPAFTLLGIGPCKWDEGHLPVSGLIKRNLSRCIEPVEPAGLSGSADSRCRVCLERALLSTPVENWLFREFGAADAPLATGTRFRGVSLV